MTALSADLLPYEEAFLPTVPLINLELTSRCNLKCPYCANATLKREYGRMEDVLVDKVMAEAVREGYFIGAVHGVGEPLLRPDLADILSRLNEKGIWGKSLVSNGTLLTLEKADALVRAGLRDLYISMDTLDPDLYRRTRGGTLASVIANVKAVARAFPGLTIWIALMNHREQTVDDEMLVRFYRQFEWLPNIIHHPVDNAPFPGAKEDWSKQNPDGTSVMRIESCLAPAYYLTIDIHGNAVLCCTDQQSEHVLGNVADQTIRSIWYSRSNQDTFKKLALGLAGCPDVCYRCVLKPASRRLEEIDPDLALPYVRLKQKAEEALTSDDMARARLLFTALQSRSPWDKSLADFVTEKFPADYKMLAFYTPPWDKRRELEARYAASGVS